MPRAAVLMVVPIAVMQPPIPTAMFITNSVWERLMPVDMLIAIITGNRIVTQPVLGRNILSAAEMTIITRSTSFVLLRPPVSLRAKLPMTSARPLLNMP